MRAVFAVVMLGLVLALAGCGSKFRTYDGPEVTRVVVSKSQRAMAFYHHDKVLRVFRVGFGRNPEGHKQFEGDGRTPEGLYFIDRRNPDSRYHLSVGISYPNAQDVTFARSQGRPPGGDIFIHGKGPRHKHAQGDWTEGCIWVSDREIEDIYAMLRLGTPILIQP